jgi:hypothetical protein
MTDPLAGVVRILKRDGGTAGTGFLVGEGWIATCAHVLEHAVEADGTIGIEFFAARNGLRAVARPVAEFVRPVDAEDVALLRLLQSAPGLAAPMVIGTSATAIGRSFSTFGFPAVKPVEGLAGHVLVTGRTTEGGSPVLQLRSNEVSLGFSGAPVWDATGAVVGMIVSTIPVGADPAGKQSEVSFIRPIEIVFAINPALRPECAAPYRGLDVFEEEHADLYFGRETAADTLVEKLSRAKVVAVIGVSGSGKSSLVRAGLRQGLERSRVPALVHRMRHVFTPGRQPVLDLERAVALVDGAPAGVVLVVDQFERLYTECRDADERRRFVDALLAAANDDCAVVLTLRADFYGIALDYVPLADAIVTEQLTLLPMSREELRRAIEEPARAYGRVLEPGLADRLVADVAGNAGDLPLLQFALTQLWEQDAAGGVLMSTTYDGLGYRYPDGRIFEGVHGAIARRAEEVWNGLDARERAASRRVFLALIGAGARAADPGSVAEVSRQAWQSELDADARATVETLAAARLVTAGIDMSSNQPTVEVSHEALLRAWPRLEGWVTGFRPFIHWRDRDLIPFWQRWTASGSDPALLLPAPMLEESRHWLAQYPDDLTEQAPYIEASVYAWQQATRRREEELERARRLIATVLTTRVFIGALGVALPFLLVFTDKFSFDGDQFPRDSLSAYYYSGVRDVLVGAMTAIGVFLITYKVAELDLDKTLSILAGACALVIALFPTGRPSGIASLTPLEDLLGEGVVKAVHFVASAIFLVSVAEMSVLFGLREGRRPSREGRHPPAFWRSYHLACAGAMWAALTWIVVTALAGGPSKSMLIGETAACWAFGASWLAKGLEVDMLRRPASTTAGELPAARNMLVPRIRSHERPR